MPVLDLRKDRDIGPAILYVITNTITGDFYVGVTGRFRRDQLHRRLSEHFSTAFRATRRAEGHLHRAIRKYGREVFKISYHSECTTIREGKLEEIRLIAELKPPYNSTKGGDGNLGLVLSEEAKRRIGEASKGRKGRLGKPHSEETKQRLSAIARTNESLARFGKYSSLGPAAMARAVICLDDNQVYDSASAAARVYGVPKSLIIEVCNRNVRRVTAAGRVFRYVDDACDHAKELAAARERLANQGNVVRARCSKAVRCISDGMLFSSTQEAGGHYGIHPSFIAEVSRGARRSAHGLLFKYEDN